MPECIFCDEPCEEGCEECPGCLKKPFPGMYFDPKTFEKATGLEGDGDLREGLQQLAAHDGRGDACEPALGERPVWLCLRSRERLDLVEDRLQRWPSGIRRLSRAAAADGRAHGLGRRSPPRNQPWVDVP